MRILEIKRHDWSIYLGLVGEYLANRSAGLWREEPDGRVSRLTAALPFTSIGLRDSTSRRGAIEIVLQAHKTNPCAFFIDAPLRLWLSLAEDGWVDGLLIEDHAERRTLVRFEDRRATERAAFFIATDWSHPPTSGLETVG